jgi:DNA-binding IclR family transcriptional regulator
MAPVGVTDAVEMGTIALQTPACHRRSIRDQSPAYPLMDKSRPKAKIQSLARANTILDKIATAPEGRMKLAEIAEAVRLHKNTVFSLLETLRALGYVRQAFGSREYMLGNRLFELALMSEADLDVAQLARPLMRKMVAIANESSSLGIPGTDSVLIVTTIESSQGVRGARYSGRHSPYHAAAIGKVILANMSIAERGTILGDHQFERLTPKTITSAQTLARELDEISQRGFALSLEEEELGANAVAVPLFGRMREVVGGISVWGPAPRLARDRLMRIGRQLVQESANFPPDTVI